MAYIKYAAPRRLRKPWRRQEMDDSGALRPVRTGCTWRRRGRFRRGSPHPGFQARLRRVL